MLQFNGQMSTDEIKCFFNWNVWKFYSLFVGGFSLPLKISCLPITSSVPSSLCSTKRIYFSLHPVKLLTFFTTLALTNQPTPSQDLDISAWILALGAVWWHHDIKMCFRQKPLSERYSGAYWSLQTFWRA